MGAALAPILAGDPDPERRRRRGLAYLETYNTNPALAGPLLGALARLEALGNEGDEAALAQAERLRRALEAPLAAGGDAFLWSAVRPLAVLVGAVVAWAEGLAGIIVLLVLYNAVHLGLRLGGIAWGHAHPERVPGLVRMPWLRSGTAALRRGAALAVLVLTFLLLAPVATWGMLLACALPALGVWVRERRGFAHGGLLAGGAIMFGLILAFLFGRGGS